MTNYVFKNAQYDIYGTGFSTYAEIEAVSEDGETEYFSLVNTDGLVNFYRTDRSVFDKFSETDLSEEMIEYLGAHQLMFSSYEEVYANPDYPFHNIQKLLIYLESGDDNVDELIENNKGKLIDEITIPNINDSEENTGSNDSSSESEKEPIILKKMRWGYDGGGIACGPVEGNTLVEAAVVTDGEIWFVLDSRMSEFEHIYISRVPLFDRLMIRPSGLTSAEEDRLIEEATLEEYDYEIYDIKEDSPMYKSRFGSVINLCRLAMEECYGYGIPNDLEADEWSKDYLDEDLNEMDIRIVVSRHSWEEDEEEEDSEYTLDDYLEFEYDRVKNENWMTLTFSIDGEEQKNVAREDNQKRLLDLIDESPSHKLLSYEKSTEEEVKDTLRQTYTDYKPMTLLNELDPKTMRWAYDGGGIACGPIEGSYITEILFHDENNCPYFVSVSRMSEYMNVYASEVSLFDLLLWAGIGDSNIEDYLEKVKNMRLLNLIRNSVNMMIFWNLITEMK